jgi:hypothetical protein
MRSRSTLRRRERLAVLLTLIPPGSFLALVLMGDRVRPLIGGFPFFPSALVLWTIASALCLALAARVLGERR